MPKNRAFPAFRFRAVPVWPFIAVGAGAGRTCIDCHKGIARRLPDMSGVPGWE